MRLGTQTLIQALTAIPWTDDTENEEEPATHDNDARLSEDEDDDKFGASTRDPPSGSANPMETPSTHRSPHGVLNPRYPPTCRSLPTKRTCGQG